MATITIKEIPDELYAELKGMVKRNRRSVNSEVICYVGQTGRSRRLDMEPSVARARQIRALTADSPIDIDNVMGAMEEGRL